MIEQKQQVEKIRQAFNQEFGRFADLRVQISELNLADAENFQRELAELKTGHTGKKSEIAGAKKLIGKVAPEDRGAFGQFVQTVEREITSAIEDVENQLNDFIAEAKSERERLDVTLPGRRPRVGHLHIADAFCANKSKIFSFRSVIRLKTTAKSKPIITISTRSTFPKIIRRANRRTLFIRPAVFALRSQTSTVQIRAMERRGAPLRIIAPGRVFSPRHARYDAYTDVSSNRRLVRGQGNYDGASQRHGRRMAAAIVRQGNRNSTSPVVFSVHRTERGIRFFVFQMRRHGNFSGRTLSPVQRFGMDRTRRFGNGASECFTRLQC